MMLKVCGSVACVVFTVALLAVPAAQQGGTASTEIKQAVAAFVTAFNKGDAASIAKMYSADAQVFPPNSEVVRGAEGIEKLWKGAMTMGVKSVKLTPVEIEAHGTSAHETGTYSMLAADGKEVDRGKYIVIWKKDGTAWKLHRDIWNSSVPAKH